MSSGDRHISRTRLTSTVDCVDFREMVDGFIDGELDDHDHRMMEDHSAQCADCNDMEARRRDTRQRLRATGDQFRASSDFMTRLNASLTEAREEVQIVDESSVAAQEHGPTPTGPLRVLSAPNEHQPVGQYRQFPVRYILAAVAVVALGLGLAAALSSRADDSDQSVVAGVAATASPIVAESVAWHRRNVPVEVVGPDANTVRDWFSDKVYFAVSVPNLGRSARLLGGRLSHVRQYEAAYLLYEVDGSKMSVMMFDADNVGDDIDLSSETFLDNSNGYNVAIREKNGVVYTFTGDMRGDALTSMVDQAMEH